MPVFMNYIETVGKTEHIRKGINNRAMIEKKQEISFDLKKTRYMIVKTGTVGEINETVKAGRIQRTDKCKYLGITISPDGKLTERVKELNARCDIIYREICAIGEKSQVGRVEVSVKLKIFQTYLMPVFLYGKENRKKFSKAEIRQRLKRIFNLPITKP